jgi:hypothetical protein
MDGSFTQGVLVLEKLTFGGIDVLNVFSGCGHSNHGLVTELMAFLALEVGHCHCQLSFGSMDWLTSSAIAYHKVLFLGHWVG